jgi:acyl-CoA synthetase (NDP forming)
MPDFTQRSALDALFQPSSIAVVGASPRPGAALSALNNFTSLGFQGRVSAINPKYDNVAGIPCFPSLTALDHVPDAVLIAVGRDRVAEAVEQAAALGVRAGVIFATGFSEVGPEGQLRQERIVAAARTANMALLGPNCQGFIDFHTRTALYMDDVESYQPGQVALIAQSGSVSTALINNRRGVRWSRTVSTGNEAVVNSADLLEYFVEQDDVRVICAFLETVRDPDKFFAVCDRARELGKPILVAKSGRTEAARAAATAHSGTLAAPDRLVDAAFRRHGVIRAESLDELLNTAVAMQLRRRPKGGRMAAITASGGQIELVLDAATGLTLELPEFSEHARAELAQVLDPTLATTNPLDYWGTPNPEENLERIVRLVAQDDIDIVALMGDFTVGPTGLTDRAHDVLRIALKLAQESECVFAVVDLVAGTVIPSQVEEALQGEVLALSGLQQSLRALEHLVTFSTSPMRPAAATRQRLSQQELESAEAALGRSTTNVVSGSAAIGILRAIGLSTPGSALVTSSDEALTAAAILGYPLVAKIGDEDVAHKTERGGVLVGIRADSELKQAMEQLVKAGASKVLLQEQIEAGTELYLGLQHAEGLGGFILVGFGGIWTEFLDDICIRPIGLAVGEPEEMLQQLRGYKRLIGARGQEHANLEALADAIHALDGLACSWGARIRELDVNPLIVTGQRAVAVDALVVLRDEQFPGANTSAPTIATSAS